MKIYLVSAALFMGLLVNAPLSAEVTIVRSLPESGEHKAEAEWKDSAKVSPEKVDQRTPDMSPELSGRIIFGGYGAGDADSASIENWTTDSQIKFSSFVGQAGIFEASAQAFREDAIDRFDQNYNGNLHFATPELSMRLSGGYKEKELITPEGTSFNSTGSVGFNFSTPEQSRIPTSLDYKSTWRQSDKELKEDLEEDPSAEESESGTVTEPVTDTGPVNKESHLITLVSTMHIGESSVDVKGAASIKKNLADEITSHGYNGTVGVNVPISGVISVIGSSSPAFSFTDYELTEKRSEERSVENDLGVLFLKEEVFEVQIKAGRRDAWRSDPDFRDNSLSHTSVWKGMTSAELIYPDTLTSKMGYEISRESEGDLGHDLSASTGWQREEGLLREASLYGQYLLNESEKWKWGSDLLVVPFDTGSVSAGYDGYHKKSEGQIWQHRGKSSFIHTPVEEFSYNLAGGYGYYEKEDATKNTYSASGGIKLRPIIKNVQPSFGINEAFELQDISENTSEGNSKGKDKISKTTTSVAVPFSRQMRMQYNFILEWVDFYLKDVEEGFAFLHRTGFSLSGKPLPFMLKADYLIGHGFRGVQHQVDASLEIPMLERWNLISKLSYRYAESITYETPFIFSALLHYEF